MVGSTQAQVAPTPPPTRDGGGFNVTLTADGLITLTALAWLLWDRLLKSQVVAKFDGVFTPIEEERKLNNLLAQVGVITNASRVVLAAFHNGAIDNCGYHLVKLSTINTYTAPGRLPMTVPIRDLPVGRITAELTPLLDAAGEFWSVTRYSEDLPAACRDHLKKNNIGRMYNRLVRVGTLPIGILSLQYDPEDGCEPPMESEPHSKLLEHLFGEISAIMRRRVIYPGLIRKLWMKIRGGGVECRNAR